MKRIIDSNRGDNDQQSSTDYKKLSDAIETLVNEDAAD